MSTSRSYDTEDDALGHQRTGFIWTGAQAAGKTVRDFGEFHQFLTKPADATWQNLYCDTKNMAATGQNTAYPLVSSSPIPSLNDGVGARLPEVRHQRPGHLPVRDLEA